MDLSLNKKISMKTRRVLAFAVALLAIVVSPDVAHSQTWTTPDGLLTVTQPNAEIFTAVDSPPEPIVGLWVSNDESTKLGVVKNQIPTNTKLIQSSVEKGLAEEIGGEVTRLPTKQVAGYEVWHMKATGTSAKITQAILRIDDTVYKLMAVTVGQNPDEQTINHFIDSLLISQSAKTVAPESNINPSEPNNNLDGGIDLHGFSKSIGGFAALLGIGLLIYFATRGKNKRQS